MLLLMFLVKDFVINQINKKAIEQIKNKFSKLIRINKVQNIVLKFQVNLILNIILNLFKFKITCKY